MLLNNVKVAALGALTLSVAPTAAFFRMPCPSRLVQERADPIVNPGVVGGHVHTISGGSAFAFSMSYEDARASECSSCPIKQDLSNYWTPKLYYHAKNGSFISVPQVGDGNGAAGGMIVYYLYVTNISPTSHLLSATSCSLDSKREDDKRIPSFS
jgi:hypothetical protein